MQPTLEGKAKETKDSPNTLYNNILDRWAPPTPSKKRSQSFWVEMVIVDQRKGRESFVCARIAAERTKR
jgi:hypothetical protein